MSGPGGDEANALASSLREVIERLVENEVPAERLSRAASLARDLRDALEGERRPRWYDAPSEPGRPSEAARASYLAQSPVRGRGNPIAPPLRVRGWALDEAGRRVLEADALLGPAYEGPPHGVHGGIVAALFDDLLGQAQQSVDKAGVTAKLEVRYRHITPVGELLRLRAWIHEDRGRWVTARATCHAGDLLTADAQAMFVGVDFEEVRGRMLSRRGGDGGESGV